MSATLGSAASATVHAARDVLRRVQGVVDPSGTHRASSGHRASGWLAVTVLREEPEVDLGDLPAPLAQFGERVEVRTRPAPGGKGTELAARLRDRPSGTTAGRLTGDDPQADLRSALRAAKQLLEVGEVLVLDPAPHGERTATPGGALLEAWTKAAPGAGVR